MVLLLSFRCHILYLVLVRCPRNDDEMYVRADASEQQKDGEDYVALLEAGYLVLFECAIDGVSSVFPSSDFVSSVPRPPDDAMKWRRRPCWEVHRV